MRAGRLILVVATLVTILVFPILIRDALHALQLPNAYAAPGTADPGGRVYANGNNGDDDNDNRNGHAHGNNNNNNNSDDEEDNDNVECFASLNSNEEVPCDFNTNGNTDGTTDSNGNFRSTNGNDNRGAAPSRRFESVNGVTKCFDTREVGVIQLGTGSYDVTVQVFPHSSFGQTTRMTLRPLDPATQPAVTGGTLLDSVIFQLDAQSGCDGAAIGTLPNNVNMGITYNVPNTVDKSKLQIVMLQGGSWVNVTTVPDPNPGNPYISTTINTAGTYAVIQRP